MAVVIMFGIVKLVILIRRTIFLNYFPVVVVFTRANLYLKSKQNSTPPGIIALVAGVKPREINIYSQYILISKQNIVLLDSICQIRIKVDHHKYKKKNWLQKENTMYGSYDLHTNP